MSPTRGEGGWKTYAYQPPGRYPQQQEEEEAGGPMPINLQVGQIEQSTLVSSVAKFINSNLQLNFPPKRAMTTCCLGVYKDF